MTWDRDDLEREVERTREELDRYSGVHEISLGPMTYGDDAHVPHQDLLAEATHRQVGAAIRSIWAPIAKEQLIFPMWLFNPDGWPRRFVLFPRLDRWGRTVRWWKRDLSDWWRARPSFLGGDGLPDGW